MQRLLVLLLFLAKVTFSQGVLPAASFISSRANIPNTSQRMTSASLSTTSTSTILKSFRDNHGHDEEEDEEEKDETSFPSPISNNANSMVDQNSFQLQQRLNQMRVEIYSQQIHLPPNPNLNPTQFITVILEQLQNPNMPLSGYRTLIRSSSDEWKNQLRLSIGVPNDAEISEETFVITLGEAISRPKNQYEILVQDNGDGSGAPVYALYFPADVVDYEDGKCWVESRLRHPESGILFAILGWSLVMDENDAWLVDTLGEYLVQNLCINKSVTLTFDIR